MKKCTLSLLGLALLAGTITANGATVTTDVMDATTDGSFLKIISDAPDNTPVDIDFNFNGTTLTYTGDAAILLKNKKISINGLNAKNNKRVIFTSPVKNGTDDKGNAIKVSSSLFNIGTGTELTLKNIEITGCQKIAIFITDGKLNIENSAFYKNVDLVKESGNNGGVIRHSGGTVNINNSVFSENEGYGSYGGGAICSYNTADIPCVINITNSSFIFNQSTNGGAYAINLRDNSTLPSVYIANCTFADNYVANRGGAAYFQTAKKTGDSFAPVLINNTFVGNITGIVTSDDGGALNFWSRATSVIMKPVIVNCIFAENYFDPWGVDRLNDIKCFYFKGDVSGGTEQPQTIDPQVSNNIYSASQDRYYTLYGNKNNSFLLNFKTDKLFKAITLNHIEGGDPEGTHMSAALEGDLQAAAICEGSIASGKGIASFNGITAPTTDQAGHARPATPSIGAMEYSVGGGVSSVTVANGISLWKAGDNLMAKGINETATINIYDAMGKLVLTHIITEDGINIGSLSNGLYIAKVQNSTLKFVK